MAVDTFTRIGEAVRRREDPRFITGTGMYVDDVQLVGMHFMAVLRSPHGHARIRSIYVEAARNAPGVIAVFTGQDLVDGGIADVPCGWSLPDLKVPKHPPLAIDTVRFQGDSVAVVIADSRGHAEDALEAITVDYEELPAVVDAEQAIQDGAPQIHPDIPNNITFTWRVGGGDVNKAFAEADRVLSQRMINQRLIPNAIEPRGLVVQYVRATQDLTMWSSTQIPHIIRLLLALTLGHPEEHIRVISPDVGGAFGSKLYLYPEEMVAAFVAKQLPGIPIKWTPSRSEEYQTTTHGRDHAEQVEFSVMNDGTITGIRVHTVANLGAYLSTFAPGIPTILFGLMLSGVYRVPNIECEVVGVLTNTVMVDAYRGAGRPEATYLIERMVDIVADELGMDPADVRRKNFIPADEFPYATPTGVIYDSGNYGPALDRALELAGYEDLRAEQERARAEGRLFGIGMASYVEICGMAPSAVLGAVGGGVGGWETAEVRVHPTGKVSVYSGACWHGQGLDTGFSQIVSSELGIPMDNIEVVHGDTEKVAQGNGTFGSRSMAVGGIAVYKSTEKVKEKVRKIAAHLLEADVEDVVYEDGKAFVRGVPDRAKTFGEVALAAYTAHNYPSDLEPGLSEATYYDPSNFTWPFGTHVAVVEIDRDTGAVSILKYLAVDDCGQVINPILKDGQVHGGIAQGIAQALYEHGMYNADGALVTGSMVDYAIPGAGELPLYTTDETRTPSPVNALGVKGIGEAGTIASTPTMVNAVMDALSPLGIRHLDMPLTPETLWRAVRTGGQA
jgi:aerobic carbon-monoxide dehydrogenase large subunit